MIDGVVLDAFGTILKINCPMNPYRELIREGRRQGLALSSDTIHRAMTTNLSFTELCAELQISLTPSKRKDLTKALKLELSSIEPYPDAVEAVSRLQDAGVKLGICSNLSAPYGPVVRRLFPNLEAYAFSFELGVMKPHPVIYQSICDQMKIEAGQYLSRGAGGVYMIGDSKRCDQDGPRSVGIMGLHLDRTGRGSINDLVQFAELVINHNCKLS
ncbi:HAD family hydrolase [Pseudomonas syringae]|uniref:HAD family hydrolase n=1 Tax=Pseudomonas syringae TaxID=317 RepID=UPI0004639581|nr:HAD family hydrolase [Pseudomonas syringae]